MNPTTTTATSTDVVNQHDQADGGSGSRWSSLLSTIGSLFEPCKPIIICPSFNLTRFANYFMASSSASSSRSSSISSSTVIGTILCDIHDSNKKRSKVKLCFQQEQCGSSTASPARPLLILDLPIGNCELDGGACRIVLECDRASSGDGPLLKTPAWTVYFNGKRVGFAWRREAVEVDDVNADIGWALESVRPVSTGIGILPPTPTRSASTSTSSSPSASAELLRSSCDGCRGGRVFEYFRGRFERVVGSVDSESYHLVDPAGCFGHELSFFFVRL